MAKLREMRKKQISKTGKDRPKPTLQSLGLANIKKEVADMAPGSVAKRIAQCIAEAALSIVAGKGVILVHRRTMHFGSPECT